MKIIEGNFGEQFTKAYGQSFYVSSAANNKPRNQNGIQRANCTPADAFDYTTVGWFSQVYKYMNYYEAESAKYRPSY